MEYLLHLLTITGIYVTLAVSLDLLAGYTGLVSLAHAGLYGIGAYTSALLALHLGVPFVSGTCAAAAICAVLSGLVAATSIRLHDDYFVIAVFALQMVAFTVLNNWMDVTRGPLGLSAIPRPDLLGWSADSVTVCAALSIALACITYFIVRRIVTSPYGRVLAAIREDEVFALSLGKNVRVAKIAVCAVSAGLAGAAGSLYARYVTYISPGNFGVNESILILSMLIIGGAASRTGPVIGAAIYVAVPEGLRFIGVPAAMGSNFRQILFGLLLLAVLVGKPRGITGRYGFGR